MNFYELKAYVSLSEHLHFAKTAEEEGFTELAAKCSFSVFRNVVDKGGVVRAINAKGCADYAYVCMLQSTALCCQKNNH